MYIYLQPFHSKGLIDDANKRLLNRGVNLNAGDSLALRVRYGMAALSSLSQTIHYLGLWTISALTSFFLMGLSSRLNALEDRVGGLAVASFMAFAMAAGSVIFLPFATIATQRIIDHVDRSFKTEVDHFESDLMRESNNLRNQRKSLAMARDEASHSERYFDPLVKKMLQERHVLAAQLREAYPQDVEARGAAYSDAAMRMKRMALQHTEGMKNEPFSRREIDKHLVRNITLMAENGVAELYSYCLEVWSSRIRSWGSKFDREGFSRHCLQLFHSLKVTKRIERLVRDVKEAEDKDKAFRESQQGIRRELSDIKNRVRSLHQPWWWTRLWRKLYPHISTARLSQAIDRVLDPDFTHFARAQ
jgi:hypothetical protein